MRADREKLQRILLKLLGNAVEFTDARGGVLGRIAIHARDTDVGIAPEACERIFEPFVQADQRLTRPHTGAGLGLAISRDLARGMDGEPTVESRLGAGTTFTLPLPAAP